MAITAVVTLSGDWLENLGNRRATTGSLATGGGTYATGGFSITAAQVGLGVLEFLDVTSSDSGFLAIWDKTNSKIKLFQSTTGAPNALVEVAAATVITTTLQFKAFGR